MTVSISPKNQTRLVVRECCYLSPYLVIVSLLFVTLHGSFDLQPTHNLGAIGKLSAGKTDLHVVVKRRGEEYHHRYAWVLPRVHDLVLSLRMV